MSRHIDVGELPRQGEQPIRRRMVDATKLSLAARIRLAWWVAMTTSIRTG